MNSATLNEEGFIIVLNGVTSSGKSSISAQLKQDPNYMFFVLSNDLFEEMVGYHHIQKDWWEHYYLDIVSIEFQTAVAIIKMGYNVIIEGVFLEPYESSNGSLTQLFNRILGNHQVVNIKLTCSLDICRERNLLRGDRDINLSEWQLTQEDAISKYNYEIETSHLTPEDCAKKIITFLKSEELLP